MARVTSKHGRDQAMDFQGFLNDMQDWELSLKDNDKKMKPHAATKNKTIGEKGRPTGKVPMTDSSSSTSEYYNYSHNYDAISRISSSLSTEESYPDAASEKELGNEYFKQKKFDDAIECYSRSIALSPTAVAYANRAMSYLKIRRFQEAEDDCTSALNLDDRYIKAYSRRATARRELRKLKESMEDSEFALRLEPNNQELKKQYGDVKSLYEKEIFKKATGVPKNSVEELQKAGELGAKVNGNGVRSVSNSTQKSVVEAIEEVHPKTSSKSSLNNENLENKNTGVSSRREVQEVEGSNGDAVQGSHLSCHRTRKQPLKPSVQELATRAASRSIAEAAQNISPPNSAYQFELSWQGFSGDCALQARLLKVTSPSGLPGIFKNALSAPMLIDIIKCVATFFLEDMDLAVKYIDNLTKVSRFNMLIMCLSSTDKADLLKIWNEVFLNEATPIEYIEILEKLRPKYCAK